MPDGGTLRLRVTDCGQVEGRGTGISISVTDTGSGIEAENAKHLFEPFFTTKSTKGTGLGLWISKGIVQKYGGTIRFRSLRYRSVQATCFQVFLPETNRNSVTRATASADTNSNSRGSFSEVTGRSIAGD
jgi:signal transduction histidine kinase